MGDDEKYIAFPHEEGDPTDAEIFIDVMGSDAVFATPFATPADFAEAAKKKLEQLPSTYADRADDLAYEKEMGEGFLGVFMELLTAARSVEKHAVDEQGKSRRNLNTRRLMGDALDLIENVKTVAQIGTRGNILDIVTQLVDAAYFVGKWSETSPEKIEEIKLNDRIENGRKGKSVSGPILTVASAKWKAWVEKEVKRLLKINKSLSADDLATKIEQSNWPVELGTPRARRTVLDYIGKLNIGQKLSTPGWLEAE